MPSPLESLTAELGVLPPGVERLPEAEQARFLEAFRSAKARQREALEAAIDDGMHHVPALLRRAFRRMLFP